MPDLLEVRGLVKEFGGDWRWFRRVGVGKRAVDNVSFSLRPSETLGLAGESGSGKSTLARLLLRLTEPTAGAVEFDGADVLALQGEALRRWRRQVQIVFQDPYRSLNPRQTVAQTLMLPFQVHGEAGPGEMREQVTRLLADAGLEPPGLYLERFPHQLSGGQRQRVAIARAIALRPRLVVADEPVTALDVSVRAQILRLLQDLKRRYGLAYIFITHDLSVLRSLADRVAVMYQGQVVEMAEREMFYARPLHPYSQALLAATPIANPRQSRQRERPQLRTDAADASVPVGCRFRPRCPYAMPRCLEEEPALKPVAPDQWVACHLH